MADSKLTALAAGAAMAAADLVYGSQGGVSVKFTAAQIKTFCSVSPTLVTPVLGDAAGTSLALSGNSALSAPNLRSTGTWISGGTATTTKPHVLIEPTGTPSTAWSTGGTALGVNCASGFGGRLIDLQFTGVSRFNVDFDGYLFSQNKITTNVGVEVIATGYFAFGQTRSVLTSPSDGVIFLRNAAATDFGRLQFGGTTSSFPSLKRSTTILQGRLADDSAFCTIQGLLRTAANAVSESVVATHTLLVTDAAGTGYKVLAIAA